MNLRIIPRLDIKGPNLVKGVQFEGLRVLGNPESFAKYYYDNGADELIYMDVVASLYGRNSLLPIIEKTSNNIFIPLTVGGGIRSVEDIREILRKGADKASINTAAIKNPQLIREASRAFGSSTIVISIEAMKIRDHSYEAYINSGREKTNIDAIEWAKKAVELGAGEIIVTSIEKEGTGKGFDIDLIKKVSEVVSVPIIGCGGAGCLNDVSQLIESEYVNGIALASLLHYYVIQHKLDIQSESQDEGNTTFLIHRKVPQMFQPVSIAEIKGKSLSRSILWRPLENDDGTIWS
jgi:cyclase